MERKKRNSSRLRFFCSKSRSRQPIRRPIAPRLSSMKRSCRSILRSRSSRARSGISRHLERLSFRPTLGVSRAARGVKQQIHAAFVIKYLVRKAISAPGHSLARAAEQIFHFAEKSCRFRVSFARRQPLELRKQFALLLGKLLRRLNH